MSKILESDKHDVLFLNHNSRHEKKLVEIARKEICNKFNKKNTMLHNMQWIKDKKMLDCKLKYFNKIYNPPLIIIDFDSKNEYDILDIEEYLKNNKKVVK